MPEHVVCTRTYCVCQSILCVSGKVQRDCESDSCLVSAVGAHSNMGAFGLLNAGMVGFTIAAKMLDDWRACELLLGGCERQWAWGMGTGDELRLAFC